MVEIKVGITACGVASLITSASREECLSKGQWGIIAPSIVCLLISTHSLASDVGDIAARFDLIGEWADHDCNQGPSVNNVHEFFKLTADGSITESDTWMYAPNNSYRWDQAQVIGPEKIALDGIYFDNSRKKNPTQERERIILEKKGKYMRTFSMMSPDNGKVLVINGVSVLNRERTEWYIKCN